jgi:hypothetical protein
MSKSIGFQIRFEAMKSGFRLEAKMHRAATLDNALMED